MSPSQNFFEGDFLAGSVVALPQHCLDGCAAARLVVERREFRDGLIAAGDDDLLASFDLGEEVGKPRLGLGDFDGDGYARFAS